MKDIDNLLTLLNIDESKKDSFELSLTHKQILNETGNLQYSDLLGYYNEIGKCVYSILLKNYILKNFTKDSNDISKIYDNSKHVFLNDFIFKFNVREYMIYKVDTFNQKLLTDVTFQIIGFIYLESSYLNLENIFHKIFVNDKFEFISDYTSIINEYVRGNVINFEEIESSGPDHCKLFTYKLTLDNLSVIATGNSKKIAKMNCSEIYCKKYMTQDQIYKLSGIKFFKDKDQDYKKPYVLDNTKCLKLKNLSNSLSISTKDLLLSLTHLSISNEFDLENNSYLRTIGSDIEKLYLLIILKHKYSNLKFKECYKINNFLHTNIDIYKRIIIKYNFESLLIAVKNIFTNINAKQTALEDVIKSIIYFDFFNNYGFNFLNNQLDIYDAILEITDFRYINPTSSIQEFLDEYKIEVSYATETKNVNEVYCYGSVNLNSFRLESSKTSTSKKEVQALVASDFLYFFYNSFDKFMSSGDIDKNTSELVIILLKELILNRPLELGTNVFEKNYFGLNTALNGDIKKFVNIFTKIINSCIELNDFYLVELIDSFITKMLKNKVLFIKNGSILIDTIIQDIINHYLIDKRYNEDYIFDLRQKDLFKLNYRILKDKLLLNGLLIKDISNPSPELQLVAVENNTKALYYINYPTKEVLNIGLKNGLNIVDIIRDNNIDSNLYNTLIEVLVDELNNKINKSYNNIIFEKIDDSIYVDLYIRAIFRLIDVKKFYIATGFVYKSGINLLKNEINNLIELSGDIRIIAGNLQNYNKGLLIKSMDKDSAIMINQLINKGINIKTFEDSFYHGKMFYFESDNMSITIMGSSNLSKTAFRTNRELNNIYIYKNKEDNVYYKWFNNFWNECSNIQYLNIDQFSDRNYFNDSNSLNQENKLNKITKEKAQQRINNVPDELLKKRLLLWLEYNPSNIYDEIVVANQNYIAVEYNYKNMIVLESFFPGNSYFIFYNIEIEALISMIKDKSKTEIFNISQMEKRGYHVRELLSLEVKIKSYFI